MKLFLETGVLERALQSIDAVRNEQRKTFPALGEEVAHRAIQRASHPDRQSIDGDECEGSVDLRILVGRR
jgi:hypothetical protein